MRDPQGEAMTPFYHFSLWLTRRLLDALARWRVVGLENVPLRGPLLVVCNHQSIADPPIAIGVLPRASHCMAKQEIFDSPFASLARWYGAFPVRRGRSDRQAIRTALDYLARGSCVVLFPEGTRSRTGGLIRAQGGAGLILLRSGAPVLPVAIIGTARLRNFWAVLGRPTIEVVIGKPFSITSMDGAVQRAEEATEAMMLRVAALLPPEMRGYYGKTGPDARARSEVRQETPATGRGGRR